MTLGTQMTERSEIRPQPARICRDFSYGGDSATGSGGKRAGQLERVESCALNGKSITSPAAIVAPLRATVVRGALVLVTPARPALSLASFYCFAPFALALTKMVFLVLVDPRDVLHCPTPVLATIHPDLA